MPSWSRLATLVLLAGGAWLGASRSHAIVTIAQGGGARSPRALRTVDVSADGGGTFEGVDPFLEMLAPTLQDVVTVHHGHMPEIAFVDATRATGIWAMFDQLRGPGFSVDGWGHYHEEYRRCADGRWRIASTRRRN